MQPKKKSPKQQAETPIVQAIINQKPSKTDPNGSYTGKPVDKYETPVQDADDL